MIAYHLIFCLGNQYVYVWLHLVTQGMDPMENIQIILYVAL